MVSKDKLKTVLDSISEEDLLVLLNEIKERAKKQQESEDDFEDPIQTAGTIETKKQRPNKFLDMKFNTKEKRELKEASETDKLLLKDREPTPRERESANFVSVTCSVCGKKEKISPTLVHSTRRYRCNHCYQG